MLAARAGDRSAFDRLVERHKDWLFGYLLHLLRAPGLADDAAQESFLRAWQSLGRLAEPERFKPWLRTIGTRMAFNIRRARATRLRYEDQASPSSPFPDPHQAVESRDLADRALDSLPYAYREVLVLRYVETLSMEEIGSTLDLGVSGLKMRLKRARDAFVSVCQGWDDVP